MQASARSGTIHALMIRRPLLRPCLLLAALALSALAAPALARRAPLPAPARPTPERVWIARLQGRSLDDALATGARVFDRTPDLVVVADEPSAKALSDAGLAVDPPILLPAGRTISLLRGHEDPSHAPLDASSLLAHGIRILWQHGFDALVASDGPPAEIPALEHHHRKALRTSPLRRSATLEAHQQTTATTFAPIIQTMVDQVSGPELIADIGRLAGRYGVTVGGVPHTFTTRSSNTTQCDLAEQYVFERFQQMGFTDVAYDPFTFSTVSARNVVATLPGTETPERIIIIGGHLDSTSPQAGNNARGANDNASGVAGVLATADILRKYKFRSTIRFIAFTGEEQGLYGSIHYADQARARGDLIDGVVIYDMIGWKNALNQIDIEGEAAWLPLMNVMDDACAQYTNLDTQIQLVSFGSDHVPFQDEGYSAFLAIESEYPSYPCYHRTCDSTGWNLPDFTADVTRAGLATVAHMAQPVGFQIAHEPLPDTEDMTGPYLVQATVSQLAPLVPDSLQVHWTTGGPFQSVAMTASGPPLQFQAGIPGQLFGPVRYWLSAVDSAGRRVVSPAGAPAALHEFSVAPRDTLLAEGFEAGWGGWTHGGAGDDWQVGPPLGLTEDPAAAFSGTQVAGTDLTGLGTEPGDYANAADSWLESPPIDCSGHSGVQLSFARKLAVERSNNSTWDYARVEVNGVTVWQSPSGSNLIDAAWTVQHLDLSAHADSNASVRVRFTIKSDASTAFGGWNLDDVMITGVAPQGVLDAPRPSPASAPRLLAHSPNPMRQRATLRFELPARERVTLAVYDVRGGLVRTLIHGEREAGQHEISWDGRSDRGRPADEGVYFYRLTTSRSQETRKLVRVH